MNGTHKNSHMKQRREQMLNFIPHGSQKSDLHLLLIPYQTVQWSAERFFPHYSPTSELQTALQMI